MDERIKCLSCHFDSTALDRVLLFGQVRSGANMPKCTVKSGCKTPSEKFEKQTCASCQTQWGVHPGCLTPETVCPNPRKAQANHLFRAAAPAHAAAAGAAGAAGAAAAGAPPFFTETAFSALKRRLAHEGSAGGICHGCRGGTLTEMMSALLQKQTNDAQSLNLFAVMELMRAHSYVESLAKLQASIDQLRKEDEVARKSLVRKKDGLQEDYELRRDDVKILQDLRSQTMENSPTIRMFLESHRPLGLRRSAKAASPATAPAAAAAAAAPAAAAAAAAAPAPSQVPPRAHEVVARMWARTARKSAHCVISNQYLEYYSPAIIASFHQVTNSDLYLLDSRDEDDIFNHCRWKVTNALRGGMDALAECLIRGAVGNVSLRYTEVMRGICQTLESNQDFPMRVAYALGTIRFKLAQMIRRFLPKQVQETPIISSQPPGQVGSPSLTSYSSGAGAAEPEVLKSLVGDCRTGAFEVGKQCEDCEETQGEDGLISRFLKPDQEPGASLRDLVREAYAGKGGVWMLTADFLRDGMDTLGKKYWEAKGNQQRWAAPLKNSQSAWLLFNLYYATCMLEAAYGLSPFRPVERPAMNPFVVRRRPAVGAAAR
ncbi:hypothetical protein [Myxococcus landrumensis]|uniref:Uncharacterized protein n=1 Tax=Myxococcus landrumensis TaxID=2813577 RepID=A0ABX7NDW6_9BACT|nr:hypothetical protein [Myxococcus landrumus]QSQ16995.1 hypothetical protein JY572_13475 [Myxococcus landrumus]